MIGMIGENMGVQGGKKFAELLEKQEEEHRQMANLVRNESRQLLQQLLRLHQEELASCARKVLVSSLVSTFLRPSPSISIFFFPKKSIFLRKNSKNGTYLTGIYEFFRKII